MCGLAGFLQNFAINDCESIIAAMTDSLVHRGPDGRGIWINQEDGIALGHRRLAILDLSAAGEQPMHSRDGRYVIVYNGEVYNFPELKNELAAIQQRETLAAKHHFLGHSDTEVILAMISEFGLEYTLTRLSGMFAFALWDKQEKILHLARDRIGEKPLYYGLVNGALVFGSELKALRRFPNFNNPIARDSVALLLQYGYIPAPHSIFTNIYKLTPGTYLSISPAMLKASNMAALAKPRVYWSAVEAAREGIANPLQLNDKEAIAHTDKLLNGIIKGRMLADVPLGAFLSGGIDSSLVAALMQANSRQAVKTFTIGFHNKSYNEAEYAKAVANYLKTEHSELYVDDAHAIAVIAKLPYIYDEPFADSSAIPTFLVSQMARRQVTVCLSGDGGDEVFGGYNRYLLGSNLWKRIALFPYPLRLIIRKFLLSVSPHTWQQLLRFSRIPAIGDKLHKFAAMITLKSPQLFYQHLISQWHNTDVIVSQSTQDNELTNIFSLLEEMDFIEKMMLSDSISYLPDDIMVKVDRAGMAVSLESRAPYLDHQLIEFMWQLPLAMKVRNRQTKWLLRQVLSNYIPEHLFKRPKMGFAVPLDVWLRGPLRHWAESLLDRKLLEQQGFLQSAPILQKWQEHLSGKRNWQYPLWTVLMLQSWLMEH